MSRQTPSVPAENHLLSSLRGPLPRRDFLRDGGAGLALTGLVPSGCSDDEDSVAPNASTVNVGTSDFGGLNYAYALEQLEAAFYAQVIADGTGSYFAGLGASSAEQQILSDLALHEKAHCDFFKNVIPPASIITNPVYLSLVGKIVSVEARHAIIIRDLMSANTFVDNDVVELFTPTAYSAPGVGAGSGLERSKKPADVVTVANQFLQTGSKLNVSGLA